MFSGIHHLTFVVADLGATVTAYEQKLGIGPFQHSELPSRGVVTARVQVGETWIVLVSPKNTDGAVGQYLAANGEGLLFLSFGVDDLDKAIGDLEKRGTQVSEKRVGICDWRIAELETRSELKVNCHLTEVGQCR